MNKPRMRWDWMSEYWVCRGRVGAGALTVANPDQSITLHHWYIRKNQLEKEMATNGQKEAN